MAHTTLKHSRRVCIENIFWYLSTSNYKVHKRSKEQESVAEGVSYTVTDAKTGRNSDDGKV